jgi:hypothetical protein
MSQGLIIFVAIGALLAYILVNFVGDLEEEDDRLLTQEKMIKKQDQKYYQTDVVGQTVLVFKTIPMSQKIAVWKRSPLYQEFLQLVPNFEEMRHFVEDRIVDKEFSKMMLKTIDSIEDDYFSGNITQVEIRERLEAIH